MLSEFEAHANPRLYNSPWKGALSQSLLTFRERVERDFAIFCLNDRRKSGTGKTGGMTNECRQDGADRHHVGAGRAQAARKGGRSRPFNVTRCACSDTYEVFRAAPAGVSEPSGAAGAQQCAAAFQLGASIHQRDLRRRLNQI